MERVIPKKYRGTAQIYRLILGCLATGIIFLGLLSFPAFAWTTWAGQGITLDLPTEPPQTDYWSHDDGGKILIKVTTGTFVEKPDANSQIVMDLLWKSIQPPVPGVVIRVPQPNNGSFSTCDYIWDSPEAGFSVRARIFSYKDKFRLISIKSPQCLSEDYWHRIVDSIKLAGGNIVMKELER